jgi:hypothetical protein
VRELLIRLDSSLTLHEDDPENKRRVQCRKSALALSTCSAAGTFSKSTSHRSIGASRSIDSAPSDSTLALSN